MTEVEVPGTRSVILEGANSDAESTSTMLCEWATLAIGGRE